MPRIADRADNADVSAACETCGQGFMLAGTGRKRRYCGDACRKTAARRGTAQPLIRRPSPPGVTTRPAPPGRRQEAAGRRFVPAGLAGGSDPRTSMEFPDTAGLVICAITGRPETADSPETDLGALWRPRFPTADMLATAAALYPGRPDYAGIEGPRPRIVVAPGAIALEAPDLAKRERTAERQQGWHRKDADMLAAVLVADGAFPEDRPARARISGWSRKSRANMCRALCEIDYAPLLSATALPAMVTLTYPGEWQCVCPDGPTLKGHMKAFRKRWERAWRRPLVAVWKLEFQRRGAPHVHMLAVPPRGVAAPAKDRWGVPATGAGMPFRKWLSTVWADIVAHPDPVQRMRHELAGTGVDYAEGLRATDPKRVAVYFTKHGAFAAKDYQNRPAALWQDSGKTVGRFWGYWHLERRTVPVELEPGDQVMAARVVRRWARAQGTTREVRVPRGVDLETGRQRMRKVRRRVRRMPNGVGWVSVNDGALFAAQLARALRHAP